MNQPVLGIHHVTAIAKDPQGVLDFYEDVLGLRLVKKTVNFDDPGTYHLYFGVELGRPGTILTFFPSPRARQGKRGSGQVTVTSFAIAPGAFEFWKYRLEERGVPAREGSARFGERVLTFRDPDGLQLELVGVATGALAEPWSGGVLPAEHAIRGLHGVTLEVQSHTSTMTLLSETMGFAATGREGDRFRFEAPETAIGGIVDVVEAPESGLGVIAAGTVHHVAFRVADRRALEAWRAQLADVGRHPTRVLDRRYFESIYFREPGGVLFEFATDAPGFTRDESPEGLGEGLELPPWLESERERIERGLPEISRPRPERS